MRARCGLMQCLWELGEYDAAISHAHEMLRLNTNDNQGIRYILIQYLAELGRYDELDGFMNKGTYVNDCMTDWLYTKALLQFAQEGNSPRSKKFLHAALKHNPHVPQYFLGRKRLPRWLPPSVAIGEEDGAACFASRFLKAWHKTAGAKQWLEANTKK